MSELGLEDYKMNRIRITLLRGTKQSRVKRNEITNYSGLLRRSCLTARNDGKHKPTPRRAIPYANDLWAFSPKNKAESLISTAWGIALRNHSNHINQTNHSSDKRENK